MISLTPKSPEKESLPIKQKFIYDKKEKKSKREKKWNCLSNGVCVSRASLHPAYRGPKSICELLLMERQFDCLLRIIALGGYICPMAGGAYLHGVSYPAPVLLLTRASTTYLSLSL